VTPATSRPTSLLRHPDFVRFWTGQTISQFGSQVSQLAIPLVAIVFLGSSAFEVALLNTMEFLPFVFFALPAGVWIDRLRRRPILIGADVGRAVLLATIPVAYVLGVLTIWQLYVVGFAVGVLTVFFDVAYQAYLPSLVERDRILDGNAKLETTRSIAQTAGPAIAGVLIAAVTAPIAILVNSVTFVASGVALVLIRKPEMTPSRPPAAIGGQGAEGRTAAAPAPASLRREIAAGIRYVAANPYLRAIALSMAWANLFGQVVFSLFLLYAVRELGLTPGAIGLVLGIGNVGLIVGAVSATWVARRVGLGRAIVLALCVAGPVTLLIPLAPPDDPIPFLIAQGVLFGWGALVFNVNQVSFRQAITPEHLQGRMNATMKFVATVTIPAGSILGGVLATAFGLREALFVGAIGSVFAALPVVVSPVWRLRGIEDVVGMPGVHVPDAAGRSGEPGVHVPDSTERSGAPSTAVAMPGVHVPDAAARSGAPAEAMAEPVLGILEPTFGGAEAPAPWPEGDEVGEVDG
jgi:MFS family permease